jgi:lysophospholipase L1-like esterase
MKKLIKVFIIFRILMANIQVYSQTNLDFESGIDGWNITGAAELSTSGAHSGENCVKIGPGYGGIGQIIPSSPLTLFSVDAYTKVSDSLSAGYITVSFYDNDSLLIMKHSSGIFNSRNYTDVSVYFETPARTNYLTIGLESIGSNTGFVYGDSFSGFKTYPDPVNSPLCDLAHYMRPFWKTDTIFDETVLLYQSESGKAFAGNLLYVPKKILEINNFGQKNSFVRGSDFTISGRTLSKINSLMNSVSYRDLDQKNYNWNELQSKWITVSYIPETTSWNGPEFPFKGENMPLTMKKLQLKDSLTIISLGMSITRGMNVSGFDNVPPYMPSYVSLFATELKRLYGNNKIKVINAGLPGATSDWSAEYADKYVNPYHPDLVILDMGMNDFWSNSPDVFKSNIQSAINKIKTACPDAEFLLISNMLFDPEYITNGSLSEYSGRLRSYNGVLKSMETLGIVDLDITSLSEYLYEIKKPRDFLTNPLHPNDFMARWYAQSMISLFYQK